MKARLLKRIRKHNVILERNGEYKYECRILCEGDTWYIDTPWTKDLDDLKEERRNQILEEARVYKTYKKILF